MNQRALVHAADTGLWTFSSGYAARRAERLCLSADCHSSSFWRLRRHGRPSGRLSCLRLRQEAALAALSPQNRRPCRPCELTSRIAVPRTMLLTEETCCAINPPCNSWNETNGGSDMSPLENRQFKLASRPTGMVKRSDFDFVKAPTADPAAGEVLVKVLYISLDPAMRGWMNEGKSYVPPVGLGEVMRAGGVGRVLASHDPGLAEGDFVSGLTG